MNDLSDIRTPLAASNNARVELATLQPKTRPPAPALVGHEAAGKAENAEIRALPARLR
jgi:hypothetical protein